MIKVLTILWNSFKMALQELRVNKLRTFLSLFGITIGIFCIIGVLATIDSLQTKSKVIYRVLEITPYISTNGAMAAVAVKAIILGGNIRSVQA